MSDGDSEDASGEDGDADARFIPGIFNYCDRWCERCPMTARCRNFAMGQAIERAMEEEKRTGERRDEAFWEDLLGRFTPRESALRDEAEDVGIDFDAEPTDEELEDAKRHVEAERRRVRSDPLARASMAYTMGVQSWFESHRERFARIDKRLASRRPRPLPTTRTRADEAAITDAVEVIRWYQFLISAKVQRALHGDDRDEELEAEGFPSDSDGSAKVALIAIDRSSAAWSALRHYLPELSDEPIGTLVALHKLRRGLERRFPKARAFVRPGLDDGSRPG